MKKFFKYLFVFIFILNASFLVSTSFSTAQESKNTNTYLTTLTSEVNALTSSSSISSILTTDERALQAVSLNLITESEYNTLNSKLITLLQGKAAKTISNGGTIAASTISADTVWVVNGSITQSGRITVNSGITFVMITTNGATITRAIANSSLIHMHESTTVSNGVYSKTNAGKLVLKGKNASARLVYDGGAKWDTSLTETAETYMGRGLTNSGLVANDVGIYSPGQLKISYTTFQNNDIQRSMAPGGAIRMRGSTGQNYLYDVKFLNSTHTAGGVGFGIQADQYNTTNIDNVDNFPTVNLMNNTTACGIIANKIYASGNYVSTDASYGGVISAPGGYTNASLYLYNSTFTKNFSKSMTGAVAWIASENGASLRIDGCTFDKNKSYYNGGAISCMTSLDIKNTTISNNETTMGGGGGIYVGASLVEGTRNVVLGANTVISNNKAQSDGTQSLTTAVGGGILIRIKQENNIENYTLNLNLKGAQILNNTAADAGGGFDVRTTTDLATFSVNVVLESGLISGNTANYGGGMYLGNTNISTTENSSIVISGNTALAGGGIFSENSSSTTSRTMTFSSGTVENNTANTGAGILTKAGSHLLTVNLKSNFKLINNHAINGAAGGLAATGGVVNITGSEISGNTATTDAGGVKVQDGATLNISGGLIDNNTSRDGGGCYVYKGTLNITGGTISNNTVTRDGGGFCVNNATVTIGDGSILNNTAGQDGAGFFLYDGTLKLTGGLIDGNTATRHAGGVYIRTGVFNLNGGTIANNTAGTFGGGVYQYGGDSTILAGLTKIENNEADNGGGIYLNSGFLDVQGGLIYSNHAIGTPKDATLAKDSDVGVGGGVYIYTGIFSMKNGVNKAGIYDNYADFAADDVFSSGNNTTFDAIPISQMLLRSDFKLSDSWFEDYPTGESHTTLNPSNETIVSNGRCRALMTNNQNDKLIEASSITNPYNGYICATLGLGVGTLSMSIPANTDIANSDMFMFRLQSIDNGLADDIDMKILISKDLPLLVLRLPIGTYKITFIPDWSWRYGDSTLNSPYLNSSNEFSLKSGNIVNISSSFELVNKDWLSHSFVTQANTGGNNE